MIDIVEPYLKYFSKIGGIAAKVFAVLLTIYGLREIWFRRESKLLSNFFKVNLSLLYVAHMAAVSLAIGVLFGYTLVTMPAAAAIVSATSLIKNVVDLIKDSIHYYQLKNKLTKQQQKLALQYHEYNKHLEEFNRLNQSYFVTAYQFLGKKLSDFVTLFKKLNQTNNNENIQEIQQAQVQLKNCKNADQNGVKQLSSDLENIVRLSKKIVELQNGMSLLNYDISSKRTVAHFSGITASLTLLLCFPINWFALPYINPTMLMIGIGSALTNVWGMYQKYLVEDKFLSQEGRQVHELIGGSITTLDRLNANGAKQALSQKLDDLAQEFDKSPPQRNKVIPIIFSDKIPKLFQTPSEGGLALHIHEEREKKAADSPKLRRGWWPI